MNSTIASRPFTNFVEETAEVFHRAETFIEPSSKSICLVSVARFFSSGDMLMQTLNRICVNFNTREGNAPR